MPTIMITVEETDNTMLCRHGDDKVAEAAFLPGSGRMAFRYCDNGELVCEDVLARAEKRFLELVLKSFNSGSQLDSVYASYLAQKKAKSERWKAGEFVEEADLYELALTVEDYEVAA